MCRYLEGGELFDRLKTEKTFSEKKTAAYMKQFLSAVAYCHDRNIIHRYLFVFINEGFETRELDARQYKERCKHKNY